MESLKFNDGLLRRYFADEDFALGDAEYIIQQVESHDALRIEELQKQGFCFHERSFYVEINLKATADMRNQIRSSITGISFELNCKYPSDLYELAYDSFETDRRFHLEQQFDQYKARAVKAAYIDRCKEQGMIVFSARKSKELLGYIIVDQHPDVEEGSFQIMLGVTRAGIKGKMTAFPLYNELLSRMALFENGGYTKCCGYVSSTNIASINLLNHHLGAKVVRVMDDYIYRVKVGENGRI